MCRTRSAASSGMRREGDQRRQRTWFVHGSLGEIEQVRNSLLQGQDALLHDPLTGIPEPEGLRSAAGRAGAGGDTPTGWCCSMWTTSSASTTAGDTVWGCGAVSGSHHHGENPGDEQVYRIGGDEFAALLPWEQAEVECRLTHLLGRVKGPEMAGVRRRAITLSAGGARYPDDALTLLERADACLYESKHQGQDCWHLAASLPVDGEVVTVSV